MWEPVRAWESYNIALFLALAGIIICIIRLARSYQPALMASLSGVNHVCNPDACQMNIISVVMFILRHHVSTLYSKIASGYQSESSKSSCFNTRATTYHGIAVVGIIWPAITGFSFVTVAVVVGKETSSSQCPMTGQTLSYGSQITHRIPWVLTKSIRKQSSVILMKHMEYSPGGIMVTG